MDGSKGLEPVFTPGTGNLCLYFAALLSAGDPPCESAARALKTRVHCLIQRELDRVGPRCDLETALFLTDPTRHEAATDEVLPALATTLDRTIIMHEPYGRVAISGYSDASTAVLDIGYTVGHYYGLAQTPTI